ncbi:LysR substrate-binding domain-containing protein [Cupriavidus alkaliphilus]|uniref:LysR substrate-binding domain-containing protein n=1 Tax=Cupriavidus alkaliphilus TaxID=942866 RepID=UPI0035D3EC52
MPWSSLGVPFRATRPPGERARDGPLILNTTQPQVDAALAGLGITLLPEDELMPHIEAGRLVRVLEDWCPKFNGATICTTPAGGSRRRRLRWWSDAAWVGEACRGFADASIISRS